MTEKSSVDCKGFFKTQCPVCKLYFSKLKECKECGYLYCSEECQKNDWENSGGVSHFKENHKDNCKKKKFYFKLLRRVRDYILKDIDFHASFIAANEKYEKIYEEKKCTDTEKEGDISHFSLKIGAHPRQCNIFIWCAPQSEEKSYKKLTKEKISCFISALFHKILSSKENSIFEEVTFDDKNSGISVSCPIRSHDLCISFGTDCEINMRFE